MRIEEMLLRKKELGYSYKQIAALSGVPLGTVQKVLGGCTKSPRYDTLQALERVLSPSSADPPASAAEDPLAAALHAPIGGVSRGAGGAADVPAPRTGAASKYSVPYALSFLSPSMLCEPAPAYQVGSPGIHGPGRERDGDSVGGIPARKDSSGIGNAETGEGCEKSLCSGWIDPARQGTYTIADRDLLPDDLRTELIDGVIYLMASPRVIHQAISAKLTSMFLSMIGSRGGKCMTFSAPMDVVLDEDDRTVVQPDVLIVCNRDHLQGRWVFGAPDLAVEITSPSSRSRDYFLKAHKYGSAGVREYWIIDPKKQKIVVYQFSRDSSKPSRPSDNASNYEFEAGIYSFDAKIPVGIFGEGAFIDFAEVCDYIRGLE